MPAFIRRLQGASANGAPVVTYTIIALCVLVWLAEWIPGIGAYVQYFGAYYPPTTQYEPWTMLTALFVHATSSSILHLPLNMLSLFFVGPALESMLGRARFLALYLIAGLGSSVAVLLIAPQTSVIGASGAIFGLLGAYFVIVRHLGGDARQIVVILVLNLVYGFIIPGVAWQAHIGGAIVGAGVALVYTLTRQRRQRAVQVLGVIGVVVVLLVLTVVGVQTVGSRI